MAEGVSNIEGGIQELNDMLVQFGCKKPESGWVRGPTEIRVHIPPPLEIKSSSIDSLDQRFRNQLIYDRGLELREIPLSELTKSVVWWLEKVYYQCPKVSEIYLTNGDY